MLLCPEMLYDIYFVNYNWVDIRWQWYSTYLHTNKHNKNETQNRTYITVKIHNLQN